MKLDRRISIFLLATILVMSACRKEELLEPMTPAPQRGMLKSYTTMPEDFESGSKGSYSAGDVTLASGSWNLDDALLGSLSGDRKNGSKSARIRNTGMLTMNFDLSEGASQVTLQYGVYGSDANSTFELWHSTNGGSTWTQDGSTVTASSTTLTEATFTLSVSGNVRFQVRKTGGGRLNIDDFNVTGASSGSGQSYTGFPEDLEAGSKGSYAAADVTLGSGSWNLDDALIGSTSSDRLNGTKSIRIRNSGTVTMNFDLTSGAVGVTMMYGVFGSDANSTFELWHSTNGGSSWTQDGTAITASSTSLAEATFTVSVTGNVRFQVRKTSGGRLNIDDLDILNDGSGGGGSGGGSPTRDDNMALGNPSNATTNSSYPNNYLMVKDQFALAYDNSRGTAKWVSWHLSAAWKGPAQRCDCFHGDTDLPSGFYRAYTSHYTNSGFDRGHQCPSDDRDGDDTDNAATFLMTNIMPQAPNLNQITWGATEDYARSLLDDGDELYIIAGGYGSGGSGSNGGTTTTIHSGSITVPSHYWKVMVVLPVGSNDLSRISTSTRVIAVDMPNTQSVNAHDWGYYRTSVNAIESATGLDLLSLVPTSIQNSIEASVDNGPTQ